MLTSITLQNFKIFKEKTTFPLSKINLLTGTNGSGKSSLLQSMLLLKQSLDYDIDTYQIRLNASCVDLGTFDDVQNIDLENNKDILISYDYRIDMITSSFIEGSIFFHLTVFDEKNNDFLLDIKQLDYEHNKQINSILDIKKGVFKHDTTKLAKGTFFYEGDTQELQGKFFRLQDFVPIDIIGDKVQGLHNAKLIALYYIPASRITPKNYHKKDASSKDNANILTQLSEWKNYEVNEKLCLDKENKTVLHQASQWLSKILDREVEIILEDDTNEYFISLYYLIDGQEKKLKPTNVGFGYSYILPIIVSGLIATKDEILIIENPEAHLHPKAQSQLAKFLAKVASTGVQVFVESHSEHILNALRVAIVQEEYEISNEDVSVLYFDNQFEEGKHFEKVEIDEEGGIDNWLEGFFDQRNEDFDILFGLKNK